MVRSRRKKNSSRKTSSVKHFSSKQSNSGQMLEDLSIDKKRETYLNIALILILLSFGVYKAVVMYGAIPVPNPDFSGYVSAGRAILNFKLPYTFKRPPALGMLQIAFSQLVGGYNPVLTGAWLLNAVFGVFIVLLLWLTAKEIVGDSAIWFALIAVMNPWILRYQAVPIAETAMIFFILASFYFMFRSSNWCYLFASIASMVRYECVFLIMIAFILDMIQGRTKKDRWMAFIWAAFASVPFLLWMLGTYLTWDELGSHGHYFGHFKNRPERTGFPKYLYLLWHASYSSLHQLPSYIKAVFSGVTSRQEADSIKDAVSLISTISKVFAAVICVFAVIWGVIKRNWNLLAIVMFLLIYIVIHSIRVNSHTRYCIPVICLVLLLSWYGIKVIWNLIFDNKKMPKFIGICVQVIIFIIAAVWFVRLLKYLPETSSKFVKGATLPYVTLSVVGLIFILYCVLLKSRYFGRNIALGIIACMMIVSQHFMAAQVIGNGTYNIEFKYLVDWYAEKAQPGEKLACTWASLLKQIGGKYDKNFVNLNKYGGATLEEFVENCYDKNITYIAWTHRGSAKTKKGVLHVLKSEMFLGCQDTKYFEFQKRIDVSSGKSSRWINIYRLRRPQPPGPIRVEDIYKAKLKSKQ